MKFQSIKLLVIGLCLLGFAATAAAGGWATIEILNMPNEIQVGEAAEIQFAVRQHGQHLRHEIDFGGKSLIPIEPTVTLREVATEEVLTFEAERLKQVGYFSVMIELPRAGEWEWQIMPAPLVGETSFPNLKVMPAAAVSETAEPAVTAAPSLSTEASLTILVSLLIVVAATLLIIGRGRTTKPVLK